jgi:hypothetical protein
MMETDTRTFGSLTFVSQLTVDGAYSLSVFLQAQRLSELGFITKDRRTFRSKYRQIAEAALSGQHHEDIAKILHDPAGAVLDEVKKIVSQGKPNILPSIDSVVGHQVKPQVAPTKSGVHLDLTQAQIDALIQAARGGRIYRGGHIGQATTTVLNALARKGLLTLTAKPGSRKNNWAYGELTNSGKALLNRVHSL